MNSSTMKLFWFLSVLALLPTELVAYDFDCKGAKRIIKTLSLGPDGIEKKADDRPNWFVKRQIPGWTCLTEPFPPEKNGRLYIEGLSCLRSNDKTSLSTRDFSAAGKTYKKNIGKLLKCFPKHTNSTPITYSNSTKGEGLKVATGKYIEDPHGEDHHVILEYGYFQDSDSPIIWKIEASIGSPVISSASNNSEKFCNVLDKIISNAPRGYRSFRGRYDRSFDEYASKLMMAHADECTIESDRDEHEFSCTWNAVDNPRRMENFFDTINSQIEQCVGSQITRTRDRESKGRTYRRMYIRGDRLVLRTTNGTRERRNGEIISTVRFYAEYDRN